jgi:hypothetical protein
LESIRGKIAQNDVGRHRAPLAKIVALSGP